MPYIDCYAVTRFDECSAILRDTDRFLSGQGIALNATMNELRASIITSDGPHHAFMRKIEGEPLSPKAVSSVRKIMFRQADDLLDGLLARGPVWIDAVTEISCHLPLTVVMELGGLPPVGRIEMLRWAAAAFDLLGPMNARAQEALPVLQELLAYVMKDIDRTTVTPGSWSARAFALADEGVIPAEMVSTILSDFIAPSLDTTRAGTSNLLMLLGQNADQWKKLRAEPAKVPNAINESLRLGSPIRCFSRFAPEATKLGDVHLPPNSRAAVFFGSGNRDEEKFPQAERFNITRSNSAEHLAFGTGAHRCPGANLARLEMTAILTAFLMRVECYEVGEPVYAKNNLLRTLQSLPIRMHARLPSSNDSPVGMAFKEQS